MPKAWPVYQTLRPLLHAHLGRPAVIMGGGRSLATTMPVMPANAVYISVNDHGCRYFAHVEQEGRRCDYIVAGDKIERRVRADVRPAWPGGPPGTGARWDVPLISRHMFGDYRLLFLPAPNSGMTAAWVARAMGCAPIILAGIDLYQDGTYFDDPHAPSSAYNVSTDDHRGRWLRLRRDYPGMYRMLGGDRELLRVFGRYDSLEVPEAAPPLRQLAAELRRYRVRLTLPSDICFRPFAAGETLDVEEKEAHLLLKMRRAVRVPIDE